MLDAKCLQCGETNTRLLTKCFLGQTFCRNCHALNHQDGEHLLEETLIATGFLPPEFLRHFRILAGVTQEQLADSLGIAISTISNIECRKSSVRLDTMRKIGSELVLLADSKSRVIRFTDIRTGQEVISKVVRRTEINLSPIETVGIANLDGGGTAIIFRRRT